MKVRYSEKLKNPLWQKKRLLIFERDGFRCTKCGSDKKTLHVHHKRYLEGHNPWEYEDRDLITLCEDCHTREHKKPTKNLRGTIAPNPGRVGPCLKYKDGQWNDYRDAEMDGKIHACEIISQVVYTLLGSFDIIGYKYQSWITSEEFTQLTCATYVCEYQKNKLTVCFWYGSNSGAGYKIFNNVKASIHQMVYEQDLSLPDFTLQALNFEDRHVPWEETIFASDFIQGMEWFSRDNLHGRKFIDD